MNCSEEIVVRHEGLDTRRYPFLKESVIIGKSPGNDIVLDSPHVSRHHASLERTPEGLYCKDLESTNGTFLNGEIISVPSHLSPGDLLAIGPFKLEFRRLNPAHSPPSNPLFLHWKRELHHRLLDTMDLRTISLKEQEGNSLRVQTEDVLKKILVSLGETIPPEIERPLLVKEVMDEALGLGPLEDLLRDGEVTEIMVNRKDQIYVEKDGLLIPTNKNFSSDEAVLTVIERIVAPIGRRIDESSPLVDARLKDGSRVNSIIPPLAIKGPSITIRKFSKDFLSMAQLISNGTISRSAVAFLEVCVKQRKNIVVSGGTGSGKTTFLNILSSFIPIGERIITIEDAAELQLSQPHVVSLETRPPNIEGKGAITIRQLVRNALRMRPDRIIVGETRGGECLDMLSAMNTGHDGSLTTAHSNSPRDLLIRLETMVLMSGVDLPLRAVREQVASAIDIIIHQHRFACGHRKVTHISEITGMEGDVITTQDLFVFRPGGYHPESGVQGTLCPTGLIPKFYDDLQNQGVAVDIQLFCQEN